LHFSAERQLLTWHKTNPVSQRLASIPGIGPIMPRQNSTSGKTRLGGITKHGNRYLRRLLINGASANLLRAKATRADSVSLLRHVRACARHGVLHNFASAEA
jgi:transposase